MNLTSSTLLSEDTGVPFHQLQAEQIERFRRTWTARIGREGSSGGLALTTLVTAPGGR